MILRNTPNNRAHLFPCLSCGQVLPGSSFYCITEKPQLKGKTTIHLDEIGKVLEPYHRVAWSTRAIDPDKPCRACRQRESVRKYQRKQKERIDRLREEAIANAIEWNTPLPEQFVKRKANGTGCDPVLKTCAIALAATRQQWAKAMALAAPKERVAGAGSVGNSNDVHPFHKWLARLFEARVALYEDIRFKRKATLNNPRAANDPQYSHMSAYITKDDHALLDHIAEKVNFYRPARKGKPYVGLPVYNIPRPWDDKGEAAATALLKQAWEPFIEAVALTLRASRSAVRDKHRVQSNQRALRYGDSNEKFTMEQYHMKRIECGEAARREIDRCIVHNVHPQAWKSPWTGEVRALRTWGPLVPPLLKEELRAMWVVLPEVVQNRARPFPMLRREMKGARKYQQAQVLNADGTPLSDRLATEYEVE